MATAVASATVRGALSLSVLLPIALINSSLLSHAAGCIVRERSIVWTVQTCFITAPCRLQTSMFLFFYIISMQVFCTLCFWLDFEAEERWMWTMAVYGRGVSRHYIYSYFHLGNIRTGQTLYGFKAIVQLFGKFAA